MAIDKSRLHANIGLLLILLIGFGFGAFLFMQPKSIEGHQSDPGSSSAVQSHEEPGMEMDAEEMQEAGHGTESAGHGTQEADGHGTQEAAPNNSPTALLLIFLGINVALILTALILKKMKSKNKVLPPESAQILELEGGSK